MVYNSYGQVFAPLCVIADAGSIAEALFGHEQEVLRFRLSLSDVLWTAA